MDAEFWLQRWRDGATGFHMDRVSPLLMKYWPTLGIAAQARVLVPLCGKSLDMAWLAAQGHNVLGIELAPMAVDQFFEEQRLEPTVHTSSLGIHYVAGQIEIICGDIFNLDATTLASCSAAYDRAALVALPATMRQRYVEHVYAGLASGYRGMLLALEYDQTVVDGPPFSVTPDDVHALFSGHTRARELGRMDIIDKDRRMSERGIKKLDSVTWRLESTGRASL